MGRMTVTELKAKKDMEAMMVPTVKFLIFSTLRFRRGLVWWS